MTKVSVFDLTVAQVEALETELGKPIDEWSEMPSKAKLYRRVYSALTGVDDAAAGALTMRELVASVSLGEDEAEGAETANPTVQPTG